MQSQVLQVSDQITPEDMVEMLIGTGLDYSNVEFTGADISRGNFWGGPGNMGVSSGIILTTGSVEIAPGPNNQGGAGYNNNTEGDLDITAIAAGNSYDACVLEFDFVPYYDHMWFEFVFCSEEYHEFVGQFNDAFGFFISGPGITGPYSNNSKNIALLPGTGTPVSINTVNNGTSNTGPCTNCQYFVANNENFTQYDGFTTVLVAESDVEPMSTYHIKLAVGDVIDHIFDSGVLLQASSFCSGPSSGLNEPFPGRKGKDLQVYPNPAGDVLHVTGGKGQEVEVSLVGQDGRVLKSARGKSEINLDIRDVPSGLYLVRMVSQEGSHSMKIYKK